MRPPPLVRVNKSTLVALEFVALIALASVLHVSVLIPVKATRVVVSIVEKDKMYQTYEAEEVNLYVRYKMFITRLPSVIPGVGVASDYDHANREGTKGKAWKLGV